MGENKFVIKHFEYNKMNQMLKQVQHDNKRLAFALCHPEPGPKAGHVILNLFQDQDLSISESRFWSQTI